MAESDDEGHYNKKHERCDVHHEDSDRHSTESQASSSPIIHRFISHVSKTYDARRKVIHTSLLVFLILAYATYFIYVLYYNLTNETRGFDRVVELVSITGCAVGLVIYFKVVARYGEVIAEKLKQPITIVSQQWHWLKWILCIIVVVSFTVILFIPLKLHETPQNLISGAGLTCLVFLGFIFSSHPRQIRWRPVVWGLALQIVFALLIMRTKPGYLIFKWIGEFFTNFLAFADAGSKFVFGDPYYLNHFFAFKVLPSIVFFSSIVSVLYYLGVVQAIVRRLAWLMSFTMQTTAVESLCAAANIFLGMTDPPLMLAPYLILLTKSELHAILTAGFATIAGGVMVAYIGLGVEASHLLSASVMSAPAALVMSKLMYPEVDFKIDTPKNVHMSKGQEGNIVEAASNGASAASTVLANIVVNLIAFLAMLEMVNALLGWLGGLVGYSELSFEEICSYVFIPVAFMMGVAWEDCGKPRSEALATYALCDFSNFGSVGICIGVLGALAPSRQSDIVSVSVRAMIAGTLASLMTACIAGVLLTEDLLHHGNYTLNESMTQ